MVPEYKESKKRQNYKIKQQTLESQKHNYTLLYI